MNRVGIQRKKNILNKKNMVDTATREEVFYPEVDFR